MTEGKIIPITDRAGKQHGWRAIINGHWVSSQHRETLEKLVAGRQEEANPADYTVNDKKPAE